MWIDNSFIRVLDRNKVLEKGAEVAVIIDVEHESALEGHVDL